MQFLAGFKEKYRAAIEALLNLMMTQLQIVLSHSLKSQARVLQFTTELVGYKSIREYQGV